MTTTSRGSRADSSAGTWATGIGMFAAAILLMLGTFQAFEGLSAILNDKVYVSGTDYVFSFDLTAWGWIHLVVGIIAVATGVGVFFEQNWARAVGLIIAVLSAMLNFMFIPQYPIWALTVIAFDIAAIWALSTLIQGEAG
jgi:uncharacterized membrane-anchored protein